MKSQVALLLFGMFFITAHVQSVGGLQCYSCTGELLCLKTKECALLETHCYSAAGTNPLGGKVTLKGCSNVVSCTVGQLAPLLDAKVESVNCCMGNLCNGAETFTLSFLMMLVPLLLSSIFY